MSLAKIVSEQRADVIGDALSSEHLTDSDDDFDVLDTWRAPVVATTFNQFFRALFPKRAQHALRIDAVKRAFVIIDEPQIMTLGEWREKHPNTTVLLGSKKAIEDNDDR